METDELTTLHANSDLIGVTESDWVPPEKKRFVSLIRVYWQGLLICAAIGLTDYGVLSFMSPFPRGVPVFIAMAVFVVQTIGLSIFIGLKVDQSRVWWLFFWWSLVLVNLNLILVLFGVDWNNRFLSALAFAFLTAQVGLVIFWGILDSSPFSKRSVIAGFQFVACCYPYWLVSKTGGGFYNWLGMMTAYIVSVFASCLILRISGFKLSLLSQIADSKAKQFSISHLFIWTTVVALLAAGGRNVDWNFLAEGGDSVGALILRAVLMTLITVSAASTIMSDGPRPLWWKLLLLIAILMGIGYGLYFLDTKATQMTLSGFSFWRAPTVLELAKMRNVWLAWTLLNGIFFSSLILVLRISGKRLLR